MKFHTKQNHILLIILFLTIFINCLNAQDSKTFRIGATTEGKEFYVVFQKNYVDHQIDEDSKSEIVDKPLNLQLFITSTKAAQGYLEIKGIGFKKEFSLPPGKVTMFQIDTSCQLRSSEVIEDLALHIVSDEPITVYGLNRRFQTTDTYLAYPVNALGNSYRAICYGWLKETMLAQVAAIATEDNTTVTFTPSVRTQKGKAPTIPFSVKLNKGQTYQLIPVFDSKSSCDLTGTLIESDKPIAVFSGHNCAYIPNRKVKACNMLVEQLPSIQSWGKQFFVGTLASRSSSVIRVLASSDNTEVFDNNKLVATLNAGEFYENLELKEHTLISSTKPVLVAQYSKGFANGDDVGDPMMIIIAPTEQFLSTYRFATPVQGEWHHYLNVVTPSKSIGKIVIDGISIPSRVFYRFGLSAFSIAQVEVDYGTHVISSNEPFGLYCYGFGFGEASYDAYGNGGGQSLEIVVQQPDKTAPVLDITRSTPSTISAVVRDDRIYDTGLNQIILVEKDNLTIPNLKFELGTPQVPIVIQTQIPKRNAYAKFKLIDKVGNISYQSICVQYDINGDSLIVVSLSGNATCAPGSDIFYGIGIKYSAINNNVIVSENNPSNLTPIILNGNLGAPLYGFNGIIEYPFGQDLFLTGRLSLENWNGIATGFLPDSLSNILPGNSIVREKFEIKNQSLMLGLAPGAELYFANQRAFVFGNINFAFPIYVNETYQKKIISPTDLLYDNGTNTKILKEKSGSAGSNIFITPEMGIGGNLPIGKGWRIYCELGAGISLTSYTPERDWRATYLFSRFGAKIKL